MDAIRDETYLPSKYWKFWVYDPKKRLIKYSSICDICTNN